MPRLRPLHVVAQHTDQRQDRVLVSEPRRRGHEQLAGDDLVATAVGWERPHLVRRPIVRGLRHAHSLLGSAEERQEDTGDDAARSPQTWHEIVAGLIRESSLRSSFATPRKPGSESSPAFAITAAAQVGFAKRAT